MKSKKIHVILPLIGSVLFGANAQAENDLKPIVGVSAGTSGFGLQAGLQVNPRHSVRLVTNNLSVDQTLEIDGVDYELDSEIKMPQLLVDFHPFNSGFYLTAGLTRNGSSLGGLATLSEPTQIGSVTVNPSDVGGLQAKARYDETSPYLGLGWRSGMNSSLAWQFEFGLTRMNEPDVSLIEVDSNFVSQADLDAEADIMQSDIEDTVVVYPHLRIGVQYRFEM